MVCKYVLCKRMHKRTVHMIQLAAAFAHHVEMRIASLDILNVLVLSHALWILVFANAALFGELFQVAVYSGPANFLAGGLHFLRKIIHRE